MFLFRYGLLMFFGIIFLVLADFYQGSRQGIDFTARRLMSCSPVDAFQAAVPDIEAMKALGPDVLGFEISQVDDRHATLSLGGTDIRMNLELAEYDSARYHARMLADTLGTVWDTSFGVDSEDASNGNHYCHCALVISMKAHAYEMLPRVLFQSGYVQRLFIARIESHMDNIKTLCEQPEFSGEAEATDEQCNR